MKMAVKKGTGNAMESLAAFSEALRYSNTSSAMAVTPSKNIRLATDLLSATGNEVVCADFSDDFAVATLLTRSRRPLSGR